MNNSIENINKLFDNKPNDLKKTNGIPEKLARKILTEDTDYEYINRIFLDIGNTAKYFIIKYCFDELNETNKTFAICYIRCNMCYKQYKVLYQILKKRLGEKKYKQYLKLFNYISNLSGLKMKNTLNDNELKLIEKALKEYKYVNYPGYLLNMIAFDFKIKNIDYEYFPYLLSMNKHYDLLVKYIKNASNIGRNKIFAEMNEDIEMKPVFMEFCERYDIKGFKEYCALNNL